MLVTVDCDHATWTNRFRSRKGRRCSDRGRTSAHWVPKTRTDDNHSCWMEKPHTDDNVEDTFSVAQTLINTGSAAAVAASEDYVDGHRQTSENPPSVDKDQHASEEQLSVGSNLQDEPIVPQKETELLTRKRLLAALSATYSALIACQSQDSQQATFFHAVYAPEISVHDYMARVFQYFFCSEACLVTCLIYVDRLIKVHPSFDLNDRCIHRLLATCLMVSAKFNDDTFYSNAYYAKVCGLGASEMNTLEACFLNAVNWNVRVTTEEYDEYMSRLTNAYSH